MGATFETETESPKSRNGNASEGVSNYLTLLVLAAHQHIRLCLLLLMAQSFAQLCQIQL